MLSFKTTTNKEIFIGLIAPIGVNLNAVYAGIERSLKAVNYNSELIRLTANLSGNTNENQEMFSRYKALISEGNELRKKTVPDVFSYLAIQEIYKRRKSKKWLVSDRRASIIRQLKRPEEVELLRHVYGTNIIFVSCYAPRPVRVKYFADQFISESRARSRTLCESMALDLIAQDEFEADNPDGQRLLDTYAKADFVLDCSSPQALTASSDRFIEAFFGYPFISPTLDEYGANMAHSASLRSVDLSRQVGAAIFHHTGEVISLGCNEVPKYGGGTYWTSDENDARDFRIGHDSNAKIKDDIVSDTLSKLKAAGWTPPQNDDEKALNGGMIRDLLEFGRVIHAEMNAICDASRFGRPTFGGTLYCTTLPCHMCSRHIVASGISRVIYLEPYHKSLARELYPDSIAFDDGIDPPVGRVHFASFTGVTPQAFPTVFSKGKRKDKLGQAQVWTQIDADPVVLGTTNYIILEPVALKELADLTLTGPDLQEQGDDAVPTRAEVNDDAPPEPAA